MPDHFHALIRIDGGHAALGTVIGAFKSAASKRIREILQLDPAIRIWHRNYHEWIVRDATAEKRFTEYIRMNPWKCVTDFGSGLRGMGNPALWNLHKLGVLCSRNAPKPKSIPRGEVYLSGFHSPMEKEIFAKLLEHKQNIIWCPAWGLGGKMSPEAVTALEENRLLILEMTNRDGNLAAAKERNSFVIEKADQLWLPHDVPGGMLDELMAAQEAGQKLRLN